jgi:hypothetical protein
LAEVADRKYFILHDLSLFHQVFISLYKPRATSASLWAADFATTFTDVTTGTGLVDLTETGSFATSTGPDFTTGDTAKKHNITPNDIFLYVRFIGILNF